VRAILPGGIKKKKIKFMSIIVHKKHLEKFQHKIQNSKTDFQTSKPSTSSQTKVQVPLKRERSLKSTERGKCTFYILV